MKIVLIFLFLFEGVVFSQRPNAGYHSEFMVFTDKYEYYEGEEIFITVQVKNPTDIPDTLHFAECIYDFSIGTYNLSDDHGCYPSPTRFIIAPNSIFIFYNYNLRDVYIPPLGENLLRSFLIGLDKDSTYFFVSPKTNIQEETESIISEFNIQQNYPNPFNPETTINYQLPKSGNVIIKVFDVLGNEISELVNERKNAGYYSLKFNGNELPSGMYIFTIQADGIRLSKKMILIK
ncbi:MAG: T9SS type A sorting domain-containing protein [Ignavibacteriaceae bacterium]|jgi:hypothetical protein|nr:T9SS type A sorting domain-containing protein [Ignavibacteriaceae bacterium]